MAGRHFWLSPLLGPLLLFSGCEARPAPTDHAASIEAGPAVLALLGGLKRGDTLGSLQVRAVGATDKGRIPVEVEKGEARGLLEITSAGDGPLPAASTARYGVYWASPAPGAPAVPAGDMQKACEALAERLRTHEASVPMPAGLRPYGLAGRSL